MRILKISTWINIKLNILGRLYNEKKIEVYIIIIILR